mgnify:CR=1 FL=1
MSKRFGVDITSPARTIADAAKIFWAAGESYTMPSEGWDMTNFGLFSGDDALAWLQSLAAGKEDELKNWFSTNVHTECAAYPETGKCLVLNNTNDPQQPDC